MRQISEARTDMFKGGGMEQVSWNDDALDQAAEPNVLTLCYTWAFPSSLTSVYRHFFGSTDVVS
jgi:hypothetical protein